MDVEMWNEVRTSLRTMLADSPNDVVVALGELGWGEVSAEDPAVATALLFEEHGRALARSDVLDVVVRAALADGGLAVSNHPLLHPVGGTPARQPELNGLALGRSGSDPLLTATFSPQGVTIGLVTVGAVANTSPAPGIDPDQGWTYVSGPMAAFEPVAEGALAEQAWSTWCAVRDRALAAEVVGVTQAILDLAVSHVTTREQFGRKVGSFQAVRHALADAMVQLEAAREAVSVAHASDSAWNAQAAWALAACAHKVTLRHAFQVCGAMGLTWEHSMHRYARRAMALELLSMPPSQRLEHIGKGLVGLGVVREPAL